MKAGLINVHDGFSQDTLQGFQVGLAFEEIMFSLFKLLSLHLLAAVSVLASNGSVLVAPAAAASVPYPGFGSNCFPAIGFKTPSEVPSSTAGWWCDPTIEYAFLGFSYEVTACQSVAQLQRDFSNIRNRFHSRYVRLYGACDDSNRPAFYDDIIAAAWDNSLGVHALVWFGFDGNHTAWVARRDNLFGILHSNAKAKFVTRGVQIGSEPLFDSVLSPDQLAQQVLAAKENLSSLGIPVTVSELAYGYQESGGAQNVLDAIDFINIHMLPFFAPKASTGDQAWPLVLNDLNWFINHGNGKKMYFDENGWPSVISQGVQPNSPRAVASISSEQAYYNLLDQHCADLKKVVGGGVGWFSHIYSDDQEPGYGIYDSAGRLKFPFAPKTSC
ncbi:glycoside hydrolase superfamily [Russula brevipes]|nr:glycoside hydrolase superfamily [Russula brevipes]